MLRNTQLTAFLALSCLLPNAIAATSFPHGCEVSNYGFIDNDLVINEDGKQAFFMIQNRSDKKIELEHIETRPDVFMSPKLESKFDPSKWAAFASDVTNMHFRCYTQVNDERVVISCREALDVCQYPRVKFALSNMGNYWVSTNKVVEQVIKDSVAKGILLRW